MPFNNFLSKLLGSSDPAPDSAANTAKNPFAFGYHLLRQKLLKNSARTYRWFDYLLGAIWALVIGMLLWTTWKNRSHIIPYLTQADYSRLLYAFFWYLGTLVFSIAGWVFIIRTFISNLSWWLHVRIYLTTLATRRLPGTIWYIGGRALMYQREGISWVTVSIASGVELVVRMMTGILAGLLLIPFGLQLPSALIVAMVIVGLITLVSIHPSVLAWIMARIKRPFATKPRFSQILLSTVSLIGLRITAGLMVAEIIRAFMPLTFNQVLLVMGAWSIASIAGMLVLVLPSNFAITEVTMTALLTTLLPVSLAAVIAIFIRLLTTFFEILIGVFFYLVYRPTAVSASYTKPPESSFPPTQPHEPKQ